MFDRMKTGRVEVRARIDGWLAWWPALLADDGRTCEVTFQGRRFRIMPGRAADVRRAPCVPGPADDRLDDRK